MRINTRPFFDGGVIRVNARQLAAAILCFSCTVLVGCEKQSGGALCKTDADCGNGYVCLINNCRVIDLCHNGVIDPGEECDDNNSDNTDACLNDCTVASCGDGVIYAGVEECDDGPSGNDGSYGGCTANCFLAPFCGDGNPDMSFGEECDPGTGNPPQNVASCDRDCTAVVCGDDITNTAANEVCDYGPGNNNGGYNGCEMDCSARGPYCGDNSLFPGDGTNPPEECDDGNSFNTDACLNSCLDASCGDGFVWDGMESCDDGEDNSDDWAASPELKHCNALCTGLAPYCGDGVIDGVEGENCDDGEDNSNDWAASSAESHCNADCSAIAPYCGDGILDAEFGEECDQTTPPMGTCTNTCQLLCNPDFGNCDGDADPVVDNGCETDLRTSTEHCGACNSPCATTCMDGVCQP